MQLFFYLVGKVSEIFVGEMDDTIDFSEMSNFNRGFFFPLTLSAMGQRVKVKEEPRFKRRRYGSDVVKKKKKKSGLRFKFLHFYF